MRQREELLSKKQKEEEKRKVFVKEMAEKKVAERAEVVQQARRLLQQKKPLCRQINRALLVSEVLSHERSVHVISKPDSPLIKLKIVHYDLYQCLRELDAQVALQKTIRAMDKEQDEKYANSIKTDIAKYEEQKKQEMEEETKKTMDYRIALKKQ